MFLSLLRMKKLSAFILLLLHINFCMLIPQTQEIDSYNTKEEQTDDINSLVEYVDQLILGNPDDTPEDEDDDSARNYSHVQIDYYYYCSFEILSNSFSEKVNISFPEHTSTKILSTYVNIIAPPPKA